MISVRLASIEDLLAISTIDKRSNPHSWSDQQLVSSLQNDILFVACEKGAVVGFAIFFNAIDCLELHLIVTDADFRQRGIGQALLDYGLRYAAEHQFEQCFLEVRQSNSIARQLYSKMGFAEIGVRKNYYPTTDGTEDAVLFSYTFVR
ncbi:MAG: hypothetical protein RL336_1848 [Pseudomonadota bacterium]|jgi:ribosomal-protein-alanine acetyltransferase